MTELKLNLGCGGDVRKGWVNIDLHEDNPAVCRRDATDGEFLFSRWELKTVDRILVQDMLEHVSLEKDKQVLRYWIALLKPSGTIEIRVPDLQRQCDCLLKGLWSRDTFVRMMFGGQDHEGNYHKSGWTKETLVGELESLGCAVEEVRFQWGVQTDSPSSDNPNIVVIARKRA